MSWCTTSVSLCLSNDLQLEIQKRCSYLKNVALDFVLLVLKLYPIQVVISLPLWIKLTMDQLLLFFLCSLCSFFSFVGGALVTNFFSLLLIDRYILAIQQVITHEEHLQYSFFICRDIVNCFRSIDTIVITTENGYNNFKVIFTKQFFTKATIFRCLGVFSVRPPQIFQVQTEISTIRPVFPDFLSVSCDYGLPQTPTIRKCKLIGKAL